MVRTIKSTVLGGRQTKEAMADIETRLGWMVDDKLTELAHIMKVLDEGWDEEAKAGIAALSGTGRAIAEIRAARKTEEAAEHVRASRRKPTDTVLRFQISTRFLRECFEYLVGDEDKRERLHLVTGPITPERVRVLCEMRKVPFSEQSIGGVTADPVATHRMMIDLDASGYELLATWHSHPMFGADGTAPSSTDLANQARFVKIGWDAAMGIVSQDGYFRLFTTHKDIEVSVYGNGTSLVSRTPREVILKLEL